MVIIVSVGAAYIDGKYLKFYTNLYEGKQYLSMFC